MEFLTFTEGIDRAATISAEFIGFIGIAILVYGAAKNFITFVASSIKRTNKLPYLRIDLGKHLSLGLEFLVGKDIIESIVDPTWDDLGKLAVLVALRTVVAFVLSWELKEVKHEVQQEMANG